MHLYRILVFALFFPELREQIRKGYLLLKHLKEHGDEYKESIILVEQALDKIWQRNLTAAYEIIQQAGINSLPYRLCNLELTQFKISLGAMVTSIGGLPLGVR